MDAMSLFLAEVRRHRLLTRAEEVALARRIERGRSGRQGAPGQLQPPPGHLERAQLRGPRPAAARPDPGRHAGADPRRREVRLAQGLQVLHLRHVLDPRVDPASDRQPGPADPGPRPHRAARAADRARPGGADRPARARAERRGDRRGRRARDPRGARHPRDRPRGDQPRPAGRRGGGDHARAPCWPRTPPRPTRRSSSPRATPPCTGRSSACPRPSARWSCSATGSAGDDPTPLREAGRRLGISSDAVRKLERKALAELAESDELEALRPAA